MSTEQVAADAPAVSAWAPLRNGVYRSLFIAQLASNIGTWMQTVGAQWFLIDAHSSPTVIALVQTASLAPTLLLALVAGTLADLFDRRRLLIAVTTYSVCASALLTALAWAGALTPVELLLLTFAIGCGAALTAPPWQAIQPELVPREQILAASSLGSVTVNAARAIGPAIAGVVVALAGPAAVFALNTVSFIGIIVALVRWRRPTPAAVGERELFGQSIVTGARYIRHGPILRRIMLRSALFAFPGSALWALLPIVSVQHWHFGASGYGLVLGLLGVGAVLGVTVIARLRRIFSTNVLLAGSAAVYALGVLAAAYLPFGAAAVLLLLAGVAWIATMTTLNAAAQLSLAHWVRARGLAIYLLVFMGAQAGGSFVWGLIASDFGVTTSLTVAAVLLVGTAVSVVALPLLPETGTLDRTISTAWPTPTLVFEPKPEDGPVLVCIAYRVAPDRIDQFARAMEPVRGSRLRTGGYGWRLYRSGQYPELVVEQFTVPSWAEFSRQHTTRWLASDDAVMSQALTYTVDGNADQHWFIALA